MTSPSSFGVHPYAPHPKVASASEAGRVFGAAPAGAAPKDAHGNAHHAHDAARVAQPRAKLAGFAADINATKYGVSAKASYETDAVRPAAIGGAFSNPARIVHSFGVKEGMKIADFGSGSGAYVLALASLVGPRGIVYAVDIQRDLLTRTANEATRRGHKNVRVLWGDIERAEGSKIADELLDGVLVANSLFLTENKKAVFTEANRVLKPGGKLIVIDWKDSYGGLGPAPSDIVTYAQVAALATEVGFLLGNDFAAGEHHYGIIFRKQS